MFETDGNAKMRKVTERVYKAAFILFGGETTPYKKSGDVDPDL